MWKRLVVLAAVFISVLFLVQAANGADTTQISVPTISIPFINGKASVTEIAATVVKTTTGSTVGIPFTLSIPDSVKLHSKIHIAAIGGLNGVSGAPGNQVLTYQMIVAIDATGPPAGTAGGASTLSLKIAGGNFHEVKSGKFSSQANCALLGSLTDSYFKIKIKVPPKLNLEEFRPALKKACPNLGK